MIAAMLATVSIVFAPCPLPYQPATLGCVVFDQQGQPAAVYVDPRLGPKKQRWAEAHEAGHVFDARNLDLTERSEITALMGWRRWAAESFADQFAACFMGRALTRWSRTTLFFTRKHPELCGAVSQM